MRDGGKKVADVPSAEAALNLNDCQMATDRCLANWPCRSLDSEIKNRPLQVVPVYENEKNQS